MDRDDLRLGMPGERLVHERLRVAASRDARIEAQRLGELRVGKDAAAELVAQLLALGDQRLLVRSGLVRERELERSDRPAVHVEERQGDLDILVAGAVDLDPRRTGSCDFDIVRIGFLADALRIPGRDDFTRRAAGRCGMQIELDDLAMLCERPVHQLLRIRCRSMGSRGSRRG